MKVEKKVRTYTRRTKSGKTVTVKAHTAKYEAADKKDAAKKKGAGKELEERKKKSTPTKIDAGKSVMNLPTKGIPAYPVKAQWGRMSARQIKNAKDIMEQTGISKKEAIKAVMETPKRAKGSVKRRPLPKRRGRV